MVTADPDPTMAEVADPMAKAVSPRASAPELRYKRFFHGASMSASLPRMHPRRDGDDGAEPELSQPETGDLSGTRGMVRRKRRLSTGLKGLAPPGR